jgi:hypothetical protein
MLKRLFVFFGILLFLSRENNAQNIYYKNPDPQLVKQFYDSAHRVVNIDSNSLLKKQFDYILKFYPKMLVKNIEIKYNHSSSVVKTKPKFSSIFKLPAQRVYRIYFSKKTKTTLDSVLVENLSFNAQLGLIAMQVSVIEDMSTGGFFNFIGWYFKQLSSKAKRGLKTEAELKTLEVGLGFQLLALNKECDEKLEINNWLTTKGYANYTKHYRNQSMRPQKVINFMNDLPVYVSKQYN